MSSFIINNNYSAIKPNGLPIYFISKEKAIMYDVLFELNNYFNPPDLANSSAFSFPKL